MIIEYTNDKGQRRRDYIQEIERICYIIIEDEQTIKMKIKREGPAKTYHLDKPDEDANFMHDYQQVEFIDMNAVVHYQLTDLYQTLSFFDYGRFDIYRKEDGYDKTIIINNEKLKHFEFKKEADTTHITSKKYKIK